MLVVPSRVLERFQQALLSKRGNPLTNNQLARAATELVDRVAVGGGSVRQEEEGGRPGPPGWKHVLEGGGGRKSKKAGSLVAAHTLLRGPPTFVASVHAIASALGVDVSEVGRAGPTEPSVTDDASGPVSVSVLDYGAGCGSSSLALMEVLPLAAKATPGLERSPLEFRLDCVEPSEALRRSGLRVVPDAFWSRGIRTLTGSRAGPRYDVALACFSLSEIEEGARRAKELDKIWSLVRPGGLLVVVEPGTPRGFHTVAKVRERVLEMGKHGGLRVLAPCTHLLSCPMATTTEEEEEEEEGRSQKKKKKNLKKKKVGEWCHFAQPYRREGDRSRKGSLAPVAHWANYARARPGASLSPRRERREGGYSEKFSYLAVQKEKEEGEEGKGNSIVEQLVGGERKGGREGRIVGTPRKRGGHVIFRLCDDEEGPAGGGRVSNVVVTRSDPEYGELKAKKWGDVIAMGRS